MRRRIGANIFSGLMIIGVFGVFIAILAMNAQPSGVRPIIPTQLIPSPTVNAWEAVLRQGGLSNDGAVTPLVAPAQEFVPPTLPASDGPTATPVEAAAVDSNPDIVSVVEFVPPTPVPTTLDEDEDVVVLSDSDDVPTPVWQPPALEPPLSRDPFGRDHYWFRRPVEANANNAGLFFYSYGSDGPDKENPWRIHHGIDFPNAIGETARAAADGIVLHGAGDGFFQNTASYGNAVFIQHDFGYDGQPLYTLYAHLSRALVRSGERVSAGDVIGLIGETGNVSGPHVHFEVRMGGDRYRDTYNPLLWMVPYVGHGVIAGRVVDEEGHFIEDAEVTVRNWATGLLLETSPTVTTYVFNNTGSDVQPDPRWNENFVVPDVPVGKYELITTIDGVRIAEVVEVLEGRTNFAELRPPVPTPVPDSP